ncbi:class I SAM-dependent methyltransferase [Deinococcus detaillensis]|uniref:Class I SAM-dependent methyltransferase n=1 Tax=Deinococcus detaillensis TaxID=2592048 RepID=A0A553ULN7_9DEIO|nr:class I SAM-dependent methyltransferase [Deinococcus detaillensis]TSA81105.1 class I SAM-dependent methyltransferase [Deinococcus detaillensis]
MFADQPLSEVLPLLRQALETVGEVTFSAPDPDLGTGLYAGEVSVAGRHRSYAAWLDIAEVLGAQLLTPAKLEGGRVQLTLSRLPPLLREGHYGAGSEFQRVNKLEDAWFLQSFTEALERAKLTDGARLLSVGVGAGRELEALALAYPDLSFEVVGVDTDESALELARQRWPNWRFAVGDVNALNLDLGRFDLIVALSVLQSRGVNLDVALRGLTKHHLNGRGSLILGFPNARYAGGELRYGARMLNFRDPDLSLLMADVALVRRHLHKHGFKVYVTGKYEVLVTGVPSGQVKLSP